MSEDEEHLTELPAPPLSTDVGFGLAAAALILPVLAGIVLLFLRSFGVALAISAATVLVTAILLSIDAYRLDKVEPPKQKRESAGLLFLGMILLWIVFYPYAFFRRKRFGGPNLVIPAVFVALFFFLGPLAQTLLVPPGLPSCTSQEVVQLLDQVIRQTPLGAQARSIDGHREISYDHVTDRRKGQCVVRTDGSDVVVEFVVTWRDRSKRLFEVRTVANLPSCTSQEVVRLLEKIIRGAQVGAQAKSIDGHREVSYDPEADRRQGECVLHKDGSDIVLKFVVRWINREKGEFAVEVTK